MAPATTESVTLSIVNAVCLFRSRLHGSIDHTFDSSFDRQHVAVVEHVCECERVAVQITIDNQTYTLRDDVDPEELRRRVAQAVFRCEVEQLHLAGGQRLLVNWRAVRFVQVSATTSGTTSVTDGADSTADGIAGTGR